MKRTWQPKKRKRAKTHGFRGRMRTRSGRDVLRRRRAKGRKRLTPGMPADRKRGRLARSGAFDRVYREGRSHSNRYFVLYAFPREGSDPSQNAHTDETEEPLRLGLSVSRKVGGAVERNSVKRAIREAFWAVADGLPQEFDFVIVARHDAAGLVERDGTPGVQTALTELFGEAGFDGPSASSTPQEHRGNT